MSYRDICPDCGKMYSLHGNCTGGSVKGVELVHEVSNEEDIKNAIFGTIDATIETMREADLTSAEMDFTYKGMKVTVLIEDALL